MLRTGPISALIFCAALFATCARAQQNAQQKTQQDPAPPPVGGVISPQGSMIFYAARGGDEACGAHCSDWIAAEGVVQWDTFKRLFAFLDRFGAHKAPVVLNVWGKGDIKVAMALGKIIRQRGLDASAGTTVAAGCAKATDASCFALKRDGQPLDAKIDTTFVECDLVCVLVLAGGVHRSLPADAKVIIGGMDIRNRLAPNVSSEHDQGLHTYYDDQLELYLSQMGVNPQIVSIVERDSKTHKATTLTNNDWLKLGLVTGLAL